LTEAQRIVETWPGEYSESRPHRALGEKAPNEFARLPKALSRVGPKKPGRSVI
jgi:hypothetical protein